MSNYQWTHRGQQNEELIFSAYGLEDVDVYGFKTKTKKLRNYSNSAAYEEVENISPDGEWVLVERNIESRNEPGALDIWKLTFYSNEWKRLTHFNRYGGGEHPYYASNPVVSPDGTRIAFQLSFDGPIEGQGNGILIYDLSKGDE